MIPKVNYVQAGKPLKERLDIIAEQDVEGLVEAEREYGESWCKRGGPGAFMNLGRKWDRLEEMLKKRNYDILNVILEEIGDGSAVGQDKVLDTVRDLRRYLALVEAKVMQIHGGTLPLQRDNAAVLKANVAQGRVGIENPRGFDPREETK